MITSKKPFLHSSRWSDFNICVFTFDFSPKILFIAHKPYGEGKLCYLWTKWWCDRNHSRGIRSFSITRLIFWCYQSLKTTKFRSRKRSLVERTTSWKYLQHSNCSAKVKSCTRYRFVIRRLCVEFLFLVKLLG